MTRSTTGGEFFVHPSATVEDGAKIGRGTRVWNYAHVRAGAVIGEDCNIGGQGLYIESDVVIGDRCKVQAGARLFHGVTLEDGVAIGPGAQFADDRKPRAINPDGTKKGPNDWIISPTLVRYGAAIGMGASVLAGVTIGRWALVGMGAVVIDDVPDYGLVVGNPARLIGYVCKCADRLGPMKCARCGLSLPDVGAMAQANAST